MNQDTTFLFNKHEEEEEEEKGISVELTVSNVADKYVRQAIMDHGCRVVYEFPVENGGHKLFVFGKPEQVFVLHQAFGSRQANGWIDSR